MASHPAPPKRPGLVQRLTGDDSDRVAADPRQGGDDGAGSPLTDQRETPFVDDVAKHPPHVVGAPAVGRDHPCQRRAQLRGQSLGSGGKIVTTIGQVAQEAGDEADTVLRGVGDQVDLAGDRRPDICASELLGGHILADGRLDHPGRGHRHATASDLDDEITQCGVERGAPVGVAIDDGDAGDLAAPDAVHRQGRQLGELSRRQNIRYPAASALAEKDKRGLRTNGLLVNPLDLHSTRTRARAALDRDVVGDRGHPAPSNGPVSPDFPVSGRAGDVLGTLGACVHTDLDEGSRIEQERQSLAGVQIPCRPQPGHLLTTAEVILESGAVPRTAWPRAPPWFRPGPDR